MVWFHNGTKNSFGRVGNISIPGTNLVMESRFDTVIAYTSRPHIAVGSTERSMSSFECIACVIGFIGFYRTNIRNNPLRLVKWCVPISMW